VSGFLEIIRQPGGNWIVKVDGRRKAETSTLDEALELGGQIQFAPGESPGKWTVKIVGLKDP
jgi:hypothetical protein